METLKQEFNSHASEAVVHLRGRERALGAEDIRERIEKSRGWAALRRRRARGKPKPGSPGRVSKSNRSMWRGEPERPRLRRTGVSDAAKVGEPAYSLGPHSVRPLRRLAGGCAPSDPHIANGAS